MPLSRRTFLRRMGAGATAAAVAPPLTRQLLFASSEPARTTQPGGPVLLNGNENAYGQFPSVADAMQQALHYCNRYPFKEWDRLTSAIAGRHALPEDQVLLGNGSTELLRVCAQTFTGPGKTLITPTPTFEALGRYAQIFGAEVITVPLTSSYAHDLDAMLRRTDASTGLIYICNPNNPTASLTPRGDIEAFIAKLPPTTAVLIDEAYFHFAEGAPGYSSFIGYRDDRVITIRTFSKIYGLAGLRLGYGVSTKATIKRLRPYQLEDTVNMVAARCAVTALADDAALRVAADRNAHDRAEFARQAAGRGLALIPSFANFVMFDTHRPVTEVISYFQKNNIVVGRPFPPMDTHLRISLGLPGEMKEFWRVWGLMPSHS